MKRPLLVRMTPRPWRESVWSRVYSKQQMKWLSLYKAATLDFVPVISMELVPGDLLSDCVAFTGAYEIDLTKRIVELGRKGGTFVDIGANLGYFSLLWAACNPINRCIAVEASPRNVEILRRNVSRNNLDTQVEVVACAAGATRGRLQFDLGPIEQRGWGGFTLTASDRSIEVDVVRVDEIVSANTPIALLKVDTEGADAWALAGCDGLLKARAIHEIWFEQNKLRSRDLAIPIDAAMEYLKSRGYVSTPQSNRDAELVEWKAVPCRNL
jgi:FkbM family methyltransferase